MMSIKSGRTKTTPMKSKMQKIKYDSNLNTRKPTLKMESWSQSEMYKENRSRICDTNGTRLSWSAGTISPNIQIQMQESPHRSLSRGRPGKGAGPCNLLLPGGWGPSLWSRWYQLAAGMGPRLAIVRIIILPCPIWSIMSKSGVNQESFQSIFSH